VQIKRFVKADHSKIASESIAYRIILRIPTLLLKGNTIASSSRRYKYTGYFCKEVDSIKSDSLFRLWMVLPLYFANFDAFEFVFTTGGAAAGQTEISVWGKNAVGQLVTAHRLVSSELLGANGGSGSGSISVNRIYVANLNSNNVSVIDGATNAVIATIPVGVNPAGVASIH
jgi:YVTN family beta-propeller protein